MANLHVLYDNYADTGIFGSGFWLPTNPLTNLTTQLLSEVARSTDSAFPTAANLSVRFGRFRPVSMVALIGHNLSASATVRIMTGDHLADDPILDITLPARQPNVVWGSRPWGEFPWDGYDPNLKTGTPLFLYEFPKPLMGDYVAVWINDTANPAGYVQIGRLFVGDPWVPKINMAYGASLGRIDESTASRSRGGQAFWDKRATRRKLAVQCNFLTEGEALGAIYDMQARLGLTGNLLVSYDPAEENAVRQRRTFYASLTQLDDTVTASPSIDYPYSCNLSFEEII